MTYDNQRKYRLFDFDYARDGAYFVTICTRRRISYFGDIGDGALDLSEIGRIARTLWPEIPQRFPSAHLDEFVIMPDHVHGILVLKVDKPDAGATVRESSGRHLIYQMRPDDKPDVQDAQPIRHDNNQHPDQLSGRHLIYQMRQVNNFGVDSRLINQTPTKTPFRIKNNPMLAEAITLGRIIRWFKGRVTYEIHKSGAHDFAWQRRFYDHVIRNDADLNKIRQYIRYNPAPWQNVMDYPENLFSYDK